MSHAWGEVMEEAFNDLQDQYDTQVVCTFCGRVEYISTDEEDVWALTWYCSNWCYHQVTGVIA
jgi:hypothetical protein